VGTCVQLSVLVMHLCKPAQLPAIVQLATNTTASVVYCTGSVLHRISISLHCTCIQHPCHRDMEQQSYISTSDSFQGLTSGQLSPASCSLKMLHSLSSLIQCQVNNSRDSNSLTTTNAVVVLHQSTRRSTIVSFGLSQHDNFDSYNATNMLMTTEGF